FYQVSGILHPVPGPGSTYSAPWSFRPAGKGYHRNVPRKQDCADSPQWPFQSTYTLLHTGRPYTIPRHMCRGTIDYRDPVRAIPGTSVAPFPDPAPARQGNTRNYSSPDYSDRKSTRLNSSHVKT